MEDSRSGLWSFLGFNLKNEEHPTMQKHKSLMIMSALGHFWDTRNNLHFRHLGEVVLMIEVFTVI